MTDVDNRIAAALDDDDRAFLASLDDGRGMFRQLGDSLGGPLGGWAKLAFGMTFVLGLVLAFAVWKMFTVEATRELILWATAAIVLITAQGFLKQWLFSRMGLFTVLREVKRLQVQVAMLSGERD